MESRHENLEITIDGVSRTLAQIAAGSLNPRTEFEKHTLNFCQDWVGGKTSFAVRTSGSTGAPKLITLSRAQMIASAERINAMLHLHRHAVALLCLDSASIAGQMTLVRSLIFGLHIYAVSPCADPLAQTPDALCFDLASFVPYQLHSMRHSRSWEKLNAIRCILVGGAPIAPELRKDLASLPCNVYATYGMTETVSAIALQRLSGVAAQDHFCALPGVAIQSNAQGCLTTQVDGGKPIITRDLIAMQGAGRFVWLGRTDHVINTGGVKIIPEVIEERIYFILGLLALTHEFFIAGIPDAALGEKVCLFLEGPSLGSGMLEALTQALKDGLPRYATPKDIRCAPAFTRTPLGKLQRRETVQRSLQSDADSDASI